MRIISGVPRPNICIRILIYGNGSAGATVLYEQAHHAPTVPATTDIVSLIADLLTVMSSSRAALERPPLARVRARVLCERIVRYGQKRVAVVREALAG